MSSRCCSACWHLRATPSCSPRLIGDTVGTPELARIWRERLIAPRRTRLIQRLRRAVDAGHLRPETDLELAADLLVGPVFYRRLISGAPLPAAEALVAAVWRAFAADSAVACENVPHPQRPTRGAQR